MTQAENARRSARIETTIGVYDATDAGPFLTRDLSASGLFLLTPGRWQEGELVELTLAHGESRIAARARSTQSTAEGVGFAFVDPSPELGVALAEIMSERFAAGDGLADRRGEPRWPIDQPVVWRAEGAGEFRARARDLSPRGAGLISAVKPAKDAVI